MKNNVDLNNVFAHLVNHIATQYDLPELRAEFIANKAAEVTNPLAVETSITPRGQLAGFVSSASVRLTMGTEVAGAVKFGTAGMLYATLKYSYNHPGGGRNGYDTQFIVVLERDWRDAIGVAAIVTDQQYRAIEAGVSARIHAHYEAKAAAKGEVVR